MTKTTNRGRLHRVLDYATGLVGNCGFAPLIVSAEEMTFAKNHEDLEYRYRIRIYRKYSLQLDPQLIIISKRIESIYRQITNIKPEIRSRGSIVTMEAMIYDIYLFNRKWWLKWSTFNCQPFRLDLTSDKELEKALYWIKDGFITQALPIYNSIQSLEDIHSFFNKDLKAGSLLAPDVAGRASRGIIAAYLVAPKEVESLAERYRKYFRRAFQKHLRDPWRPWIIRDLWMTKEMDFIVQNLDKVKLDNGSTNNSGNQ